MRIIILLLLTFHLFAKQPSSATESIGFDTFCGQVAQNASKLKNFRKLPLMLQVVDTLNFTQGMEELEYVKENYPDLLKTMDQFIKNESVGNPIVYFYPPYGLFCPTTMRYIKIAGDLLSQFGPLDGKTVVEIGGGYGGQCRIISQIAKFKEYILVDLPEVLEIAKVYLKNFPIDNITFLTPDQVKDAGQYDLVISTYAMTECNKNVQMEYIQKICNRSKMGYIVCNNLPETMFNNQLTQKELFDQILHDSAQMFPTQPKNPRFPGIQTLVWNQK